ncbi:putative rnase iii domain protein [Erysiphe necator]|uniref:Putative rnase iii domain protein n=1 Tax=Uncinula necator TaxID=52586 RepID=A0A0B1P389_UNCNE|nr:putative rnase iii domain protein [Erysiphe necator]
MPVRVRPLNPNKKWECNSDPKRLDRFYVNFLGPGGDNLLSDEVKWLAITHKSFEQGARGFNDRLAFLGRRILNLQADLLLFSSPSIRQLENPIEIESETRVPFQHPALIGLTNLIDSPLTNILSKEKLASFATNIGMRPIIRWYPRMVQDLDSSGIETVLATSLYAIVGALALEKGGEVSSDIAKNNILKPMGIR